ncbi:MAG: DUF5723 family protein [Rikenellaceae bacterium]
MKKYLLLIILSLAVFTSVSAQNIRTSYFMQGATMRTELNPALAPTRGYLNLPIISGNYIDITTGSLSVSDFLYPSNGELVTFLDPSVSSEDFLSGLSKMNSVGMDYKTNILGFGWYTKKRSFWSFDMSLRTSISMTVPKDLFSFVKLGSGSYDMSNLGVNIDVFQQTSLGYSRMIGDKIRVGANFKLLAGLASANINFDKLELNLTEDKWSLDAEGSVNIAAKGLEMGYTDEGFMDLTDLNFDMNSIGVAGWGGAIDLGASYNVLKTLTVSASIVDLGYIKYASGNSISGKSSGSFEYTGFDLEGDFDIDEAMSLDDLEKLMDFEREEGKEYIKYLNPTLNVGAEWTMFKNLLSFGFLGSATFYDSYATSEYSLSAGINPTKWFSLYGTYTITDSADHTVGAALNIHSCWINIYLGTDYVIRDVTTQYVPISQSNFNLYFGLGFALGKDPALKKPKKVKKKDRLEE